jgi:peptidoglycan/LPS O-acetylase OafA/YrhL
LVAARAVGLIATAAVALLGCFLQRFYPYIPSFLPQSIGWFLLGILTAIHLPTLVDRPVSLIQIALALFAASAVSQNPHIIIPISIWIGVIIVCSIHNNWSAKIRACMSWTPLVKFGEASYGFYIIHMPVMILCGSFLAKNAHINNKWLYAAALSVSFPITAGAAILSYEVVEKRINEWAKRAFAGPVERPVLVAGGIR